MKLKEKKTDLYKDLEPKTKEVENKKTTNDNIPDEVKRKQDLAKKMRDFDPDELVPVQNYFSGEHKVFIDPSKGTNMPDVHLFDELGDIEWMRFEFLKMLTMTNKNLFKNNYLYIMDDEITEMLRLDKYYEGIKRPDLLGSIFDNNLADIIDIIDKSNTTVKRALTNIAIKKMKNGEISDYNVRKVLKEKLNIELFEE